jgi:hypothetical protein
LTLAVVNGLYVAFQPPKERVRVLYRFVGSAAAMSVRVVEHSNRSLLIGIGPTTGSEVNYPDHTEAALLRRSKQNSAERVIASRYKLQDSRWGPASEYMAMRTPGAVFQPELIELMRVVLDDVAATLPEAKRTSQIKAEIASHILASAANGERDPIVLKATALSAVVECTHYSHDISPARREV